METKTEKEIEFKPEWEMEMRRFKQLLPYRIVWGELNKESGAFQVFASYNKRELNKSVRAGNRVWLLS